MTRIDNNKEVAWQRGIDALNSAAWIIDSNHVIQLSNKYAENFFNLPQHKIIGSYCHRIFHGLDVPIKGCPLCRALESSARESTEFERNGRWYRVTVDPITSQQGDFENALHLILDITERKILEERLRRSQRLLSNTERMAKAGGWEWDLVKNEIFWTKQLYKLHGLNPSMFVPGSSEHLRGGLKCYTKDDRSILLDLLKRCKEGEPFRQEFPFRKATGERIWVLTAAEPVWEGKNITKIIGHISDITLSKLIHDKLASQSERIERLFNAIEDAIFVHPFKDEGFAPFTQVNDAACERYGYSYEEFLHLAAPDITLEVDGEMHGKQQNGRELLQKKHKVFETTHIKKSGESFPVEINANIFHQGFPP